eukprot:350954-Chlamydomonas_euryale.AAC.1
MDIACAHDAPAFTEALTCARSEMLHMKCWNIHRTPLYDAATLAFPGLACRLDAITCHATHAGAHTGVYACTWTPPLTAFADPRRAHARCRAVHHIQTQLAGLAAR